MFSYSVFNLNIIRGLVKCTDGRDAVVKLTNIFGDQITGIKYILFRNYCGHGIKRIPWVL